MFTVATQVLLRLEQMIATRTNTRIHGPRCSHEANPDRAAARWLPSHPVLSMLALAVRYTCGLFFTALITIPWGSDEREG